MLRSRVPRPGRESCLNPRAASGSASIPTSTTQVPLVTDPGAPAQIVTPGQDAPNPFVLWDNGHYYLYSSQWGFFDPNLPVRESDVRNRWGAPTDSMPKLAAWVQPGYTWAPDVHKINNVYVMWYTAWLVGRTPITECIGVASSPSPTGPFTGAPQPSICQLNRNGSIDPRTFIDSSGTMWLYWKSDDNADVNGTSKSSIYVQQLSQDGMHLIGKVTDILDADQPWEGRIVEAPDMVQAAGRYWLFYSANWFNQPYYGIGVAESASPTGPCTKPYDHAWLGSNKQGQGPGEESLFTDPQGTWIVYSPWRVVYPATNTPRPVAMARVGFNLSGPYLAAW